jgi:hypothetical protein
MHARIYKPSRSAMQSGRAGLAEWVLEYEAPTPRRPESLMGWTSSGDTLNQVHMHFETVEEAIEFAKAKGLSYDVQPVHERKIKPRNYGDNFRIFPPEEQ